MAKIEKLEKKLNNVNELANEVAKKANGEISVLKHKITCLTVIICILLMVAASISIYSISVIREMFNQVEIYQEK